MPGRHPGVHVYVDTEDLTHRDLIVAMGIDGLDMTRCVEEYQKRGVTTSERVNTSVYSKRIVEAVGLTGAIRVSPLHCHTVADIETYLRVTQELAQGICKVISFFPSPSFSYAQTCHPRRGSIAIAMCCILAAAISEGAAAGANPQRKKCSPSLKGAHAPARLRGHHRDRSVARPRISTAARSTGTLRTSTSS